jgi:catechol 2,3-dioxygenase-like lactoylglutathione lyase family enzyme
MAVQLSELVLQCRDPETLARFWCEVLGFEVLDSADEDIEIGPSSGFGGVQPTLIFERSNEDRPRGRLHFDVNPLGTDRASEVARILAAGGSHADIGQTGEEPWTVLQDPEGNVFCVLNRSL